MVYLLPVGRQPQPRPKHGLDPILDVYKRQMLSVPLQEDIPLKMFVYPANETAALPDVFVQHSRTPAAPLQMAPERIAANREAWIQAWTETVLR